MNAKVTALVEHYVVSTVAAGVAIYQGGNHDLKKVAYAALVGILGPVLMGAYSKAKEKLGK